MTNFKINNRTISLTSDQLLLTKQIAILGFASKSHINMLYSIIKGQQSLLSQHIFSKMVNKLHIWDSVSTSQKRNHTTDNCLCSWANWTFPIANVALFCS